MRWHFRNASGNLDVRVDVAGDRPTDRALHDDLRRRVHVARLDDHVGRAEADDPVAVDAALPAGRRAGARSGSPYSDPDQFWSDLATAYREEITRLYDTRLSRYLQLDDTSLAYLNDPAQRESMAARGEDADHMHERYVDTINEALAGRPDDLRVTTHMCRGNYRSSWAAEGGYDHVAEKVFGGLAVDGFFCEYDDARSGDFSPLRYLPRGDQQVVLGLVTTKSGELEDRDTLKRRIDEASQVVPLEQLCLSPQCGFSSTVEGNTLSYEQEVAELELIVSVAEDVWLVAARRPRPRPALHLRGHERSVGHPLW